MRDESGARGPPASAGGSKDPPLMFKLLSAASLDDDSAANKDVQFPLLPCTLSSVHPREDEGLEGEARRAWC